MPNPTDTASKLHLAIEIASEVVKVIASTGSAGMPSGHLYARLMAHMDLDTYNTLIELLKRSGIVTETHNVLHAKI